MKRHTGNPTSLALSGIALLSFALALALGACGRQARSEVRDACPKDRVVVLGGCVSARIAKEICGPLGRLRSDGSCEPLPHCAPGAGRELTTGNCAPTGAIRALALAEGIFFGDDDVIGCDGDSELVVMPVPHDSRVRLACLAPPLPPFPPCSMGFVRESSGRCVAVGTEIVDTGLWLRLVVGSDAGEGTSAFCRALERSPDAAQPPGQTADRSIEVRLLFPNNDVTQLEAQIAPAIAEGVLRPRLEALRSLGGTSQAAEVSSKVHCRARTGRPKAR